MKLKYSILKTSAEGCDFYIVDEAPTRGKAFERAKELRTQAKKDAKRQNAESWADRFYIALLEEV